MFFPPHPSSSYHPVCFNWVALLRLGSELSFIKECWGYKRMVEFVKGCWIRLILSHLLTPPSAIYSQWLAESDFFASFLEPCSEPDRTENIVPPVMDCLALMARQNSERGGGGPVSNVELFLFFFFTLFLPLPLYLSVFLCLSISPSFFVFLNLSINLTLHTNPVMNWKLQLPKSTLP